jgi:hypothetical protein
MTTLDYSQAGFTQMLNGSPSLPYGEQALQSLGLSPQAAAIAYAALSMGEAATGAALENQANKQAAAFSDAARLTYTTEKFGTQGLQPTVAMMQTPQAQAVVDAYMSMGLARDDATRYAGNLINSGSTLPTTFAVCSDTELIKVVPKGTFGRHSKRLLSILHDASRI